MAVHLTYARQAGTDDRPNREPYLSRCWSSNSQRRAAAGAPEDVEFATKPALVRAMITACSMPRCDRRAHDPQFVEDDFPLIAAFDLRLVRVQTLRRDSW
jgi:hypothetical protein